MARVLLLGMFNTETLIQSNLRGQYCVWHLTNQAKKVQNLSCMLIIFWTNLIKSHSVRRRTTIGKRGAALEWPWWVKSQSHCRWVKILFFVGLRVYLHLFLFHLSVCLFICLFVYLSACLSDYLDVYLPDHLAVCPVVSLSCTISRGCFHGWEYFPYII